MGLFSGAQKLFFVPGQERCSRPIHSVPGEPGSSASAAALGDLLWTSQPPTRRLLEDASATVSSQPPTRRLMRTVAGSKRRWVSFPGRKTFSVPGQELRSGPISRSQANLVSRLCGGVGRSPFGLASAYAAASRGRVSDRFFSAAYAAAHANRCRLEEEMGLFSGAQNFFCPRSGAALRIHLPSSRRTWSAAYAAAFDDLLSASPPPTRRLLEDASATVSSQPPTRRLMRTVAGSKRRWVSFPGHKTFSVPGQELRSGSIFPVPGEPGQPPMRRRSTISFRPRLRLRGGFSRTHQRPFLLSRLRGGSCEPLPARRGDGSLFRGTKLFLSPVGSDAPDPSSRPKRTWVIRLYGGS
jgi:hypothetical protein